MRGQSRLVVNVPSNVELVDLQFPCNLGGMRLAVSSSEWAVYFTQATLHLMDDEIIRIDISFNAPW